MINNYGKSGVLTVCQNWNTSNGNTNTVFICQALYCLLSHFCLTILVTLGGRQYYFLHYKDEETKK